VFPDAQGLTTIKLQQIAREMNLSETVFVLLRQTGCSRSPQDFTPIQEIPFAGHPYWGHFSVGPARLIAVTDGVTRLMQECNMAFFPSNFMHEKGMSPM